MDKIVEVKAMIGSRPIRIEVDGGINQETAGLATSAGTHAFAAGSAIFGRSEHYPENIAAIRIAAAGKQRRDAA